MDTMTTIFRNHLVRCVAYTLLLTLAAFMALGQPANNPADCGQAMAFDGNGYVVLPNESAFDFTTAMTVEGWFKVDIFDKEWQMFITKGDHTWRLGRSQGTNNVRFTLDGTGQSATSASSVNDGNWHHIAGTYDGANIKLYIDGVLDATTAATGSIATDDKAVWLGSNADVTDRQFKGSMDEIKIWNRALTDEELSQSASGTHPADASTALVVHYDFNDQAGAATLTDITTNGHHGTLTNMDVATAWVNGDGSVPASTWYADADTDGYAEKIATCDDLSATHTIDIGSLSLASTTLFDCDDTNSNVNPGATEILFDGIDNDCNPATPDDAIVATYTDGVILSYSSSPGTNPTPCAGSMPVAVPPGARITTVDVGYTLVNTSGTTNGGGVRSYLYCPTNSVIESVATGLGDLSRTGLTIAQELVGTVSFKLNVWYPVGQAGICDNQSVEVANNTWTLTVHLEPDTRWYPDSDGDGYVAANPVESEDDLSSQGYYLGTNLPNGGLFDCDDNNPDAHEMLTWYADADGDGYMVEVGQSCGAPGEEDYYFTDPETEYTGFLGFDDCNDDPATGATVNPGAVEILDNGIDDDCDPATADKLANSLHFDGSGYITLPNESAFDFDNAMTVEGWFKVDVFDQDWQFFVAKGDHTWRLSRSQNTNFVQFTLDGVGKNVISTVSVNDGAWHHIAGTYDGANIKLYIDGVLDATTPATGSIATDDKAVWLGNNEDATGRQFKGSMDELRIWNVARSAEEIAAAKDCELHGDETGLVAYYTFNQGNDGVDNTAITTVTDASANGNSGTLTGFTLTGATSNWLYGADDRGLAESWYKDADGDGHVLVQSACESPGEGYVTDFDMTGKTAGDCDDDNGAAYETLMWYADADGDGYMMEVGQNCGPINDGGTYYSDPENDYAGFEGFDDCDDDPATGAAINPGAAEILDNGIDDDCDPNTLGTSSSEGAEDVCQPYFTYTANNGILTEKVYRSADGSSFVKLNRNNLGSNTPFGGADDQEHVIEDYIMYVDGQALKLTYSGYTIGYWNYDMSVNIWSTADETYEDIEFKNAKFYPDFDDDGVICDCDDADAGVGAAIVWYADLDGDGYAVELWACSQPAGYVADLGTWTLGDCDDNDINVHPGAEETIGNGKDDDCDPTTSDFAGRPFIVTAQAHYVEGLGDYVIVIATDLENLDGYDFEVNWGDGSADRYDTERLQAILAQWEDDEGYLWPYHVYSQPGPYTVKINGLLPGGIAVSSAVSIEQWGDIEWGSMSRMFSGASELAAYNATDAPDLSDVTDMSLMFQDASKFNGNISGWDVSHVTDMAAMFEDAEAFNQNLGGWDISGIVYDPEAAFANGMAEMLYNSGLSVANYEATLAGWATLDEGETAIPTGIYLGADGLKYCDATARDLLTKPIGEGGYGWEIGDSGPLGDALAFDVEELPAIISLTGLVTSLAAPTAVGCVGIVTATSDAVFPITMPTIVTWTYDDGNAETENPTQEQQVFVYTGEPFVTTWQTSNEEGGNYVVIPINWDIVEQYNIVVDWGDPNQPGIDPTVYTAGAFQDSGGAPAHEYAQPGVYTVKVYGAFPHLYDYNESGLLENIRSVEQWGDIQWQSMEYAFVLASNLVINATDVPDLSNVTSMQGMFEYAYNFNSDISTWDVSNVTDMSYMFEQTSFNQDLSAWDISNVSSMSFMFTNSSGMSRANYEATLAGWATLDTEAGETAIPTGITLGADGLKYCDATARELLTTPTGEGGYGWNISGDFQDCSLLITAIGNKTTSEDVELAFTAEATYGTGAYTFSLDETSEGKGMTINAATGAFSWTPTTEQVGEHEVTITVMDEDDAEDSKTFTITVNAVNDAPVLAAIGNKEVNEDEELTFTATASDVDSETLTFSLDETSSGKGMVLNATTGAFSWTPVQAQVGEHEVTITVMDEDDAEDSETFTITVNAVNDAPVLATIGNKSVEENATLSFTVSAEDPDSETLTFSLDAVSSGKGMTMNATSGAFTWTPANAHIGTHDVTVTVSDGESIDSETFTITVNAADVNDAPVLSTIGNKSVEENATLIFTVSATDSDSETLTFSLDETSSGKGMTLSAAGEFTWTPANAHIGTHDVTVTVSDGESTDSETFTITVNEANEVNDAPILETIGNQSVQENATLALTVLASDADSPALTFSLDETSSGKGMTLSAAGEFTWTPANAHIGTHDVTVTVSDGESTDSETFTIMVMAIAATNQAPLLAVNTGLVALQGEKIAITNAMLLVTDEDNTATELLFTVTALPAHGTLFNDETAIALNGTFSQADIAENRISYEHNGLNSAADKFTFTVSDGAGGVIVSTDFQISIDIILSVETGWNGGVSLYPLPARKEITVKVVNTYRGAVSFGIVDLSGKEVTVENVTKENPELIHTINISDVATGVSFVRVRMGSQLYMLKLLKE